MTRTISIEDLRKFEFNGFCHGCLTIINLVRID